MASCYGFHVVCMWVCLSVFLSVFFFSVSIWESMCMSICMCVYVSMSKCMLVSCFFFNFPAKELLIYLRELRCFCQ